MEPRITWASKLPVALIVRLYVADATGRADDALMEDVGWRMLARCQDVLLVSDSRIACPVCAVVFDVPWIGQPDDRRSGCPGCGWSVSAGEYHASFEHRDLNGVGAREAFAEFVVRFPQMRTFTERMMAIDRVVNAVHRTGGVAARNLFEGRPRQVLAALDEIAHSRDPDGLLEATRRAQRRSADADS